MCVYVCNMCLVLQICGYFSAGVVMWEIFSEGRTPFENRSNVDVVTDITRGIRLYRPQRASQPLYAIMYRCWHEVLNILYFNILTVPCFYTFYKEMHDIFLLFFFSSTITSPFLLRCWCRSLMVGHLSLNCWRKSENWQKIKTSTHILLYRWTPNCLFIVVMNVNIFYSVFVNKYFYKALL